MKNSWLNSRTRSQIVIHTIHGQTFTGLLDLVARDGLVLRTAELVEDKQKTTPLPGETWIPRESVLFCQYVNQ